MKELEIKPKDEVKLATQKQIEKKTVFLGSTRLLPNHRCFEIHDETKSITEAKYSPVVTFGDGMKKRIDIKEGYSYICAMNKENALKKYYKLKGI